MPPACPLGQQDAADLTALDGDPQLVSGLDQRIQRPHTGLLGVDRRQGAVGLPDQPAGRVLADQGDQLATLGLVEPAWPTRPGSVTEPVDTVGVEAVQPLPHGLGVTAQPGGDLAGPLAVPLRTTIRARRIQSAGAWRLAASRRRVRCSSGSAGGRACSNGGMGSGLRMVASQGGREQTEHSTTHRY